MLGWIISVYRQTDESTSPATAGSPEGELLGEWQTGADGLDWIDELVQEDKALNLGGGGYPSRYTVIAKHLIPRIVDGPPGARSTWICEVSDVLTDRWAGTTRVDQAATGDYSPDEWLIVKAWDQS